MKLQQVQPNTYLASTSSHRKPETQLSLIVLVLEIKDLAIHEIFIFMEKITATFTGPLFLDRTLPPSRRLIGILNFPRLSWQITVKEKNRANLSQPNCTKTIPFNKWSAILVDGLTLNMNEIVEPWNHWQSHMITTSDSKSPVLTTTLIRNVSINI